MKRGLSVVALLVIAWVVFRVLTVRKAFKKTDGSPASIGDAVGEIVSHPSLLLPGKVA